MNPRHPSDTFGTRDYGPVPGFYRVVELTPDGALVTYWPAP